jgi:hypothetical protein
MIDSFETNPKRDASDSIRGYVYQIYQSLIAWMELDSEEILFLEGAEDFDVHSSSNVVTTQVKDLSSSLTLRSKSIIETIDNYWVHQSKNRKHNVYMHFLSTAESTHEKGGDFESSLTGLQYWEYIVSNGKSAKLLHDFLLTLKLNCELVKFLNESSSEQVFDCLLSKISWDLGNKSIDVLEYLIEDKLKNHGNSLNIRAHDSKKALPFLLKKVADNLIVKTRNELRFGDFLTEFENATTVSVNRSEFNALQSRHLSSLASSYGDENLLSTSTFFTQLMPLVQGGVLREKLVASIYNCLEKNNLVVLQGSSGIGKSNLAALVANRFNVNWTWANLRGFNHEKLKDTLSRILRDVSENKRACYFVLDDLDLRKVCFFERELASLIFAIFNSSGLVIVTGQYQPPLTFYPKIWREVECEVKVPYFDETDIQDMLLNYGAEGKDLISNWSRIILATTSGHPQLVHARIRNLKAKSWKIETTNVFQSPEVDQVKNEIVQRLVDELPENSARLLIYKLSLIISGFSRDVAVFLAESIPEVRMPGEVFDTLIGPWVEKHNDNQYKVSPILQGAAKQVFSPNEVMNIHSAISNSLLNKASINYVEFSNAFFHAFMGESEELLSKLTSSLIQENDKNLSVIYDYLSWFTYLSLKDGEKIFSKNKSLDLILRILQFKLLALSPYKNKAVVIVLRIDELIDDLENSDDSKESSECLVYSLVLSSMDTPIPSSIILKYISRLMDISDGNKQLKAIFSNFDEKNKSLSHVGNNTPIQLLFSMHSNRIVGLDEFEGLIDALDLIGKNKRDILLNTDSDHNFESILVNQAWWKELDKDNFNANRAIEVYKLAAEKFNSWGAHKYTRACYITMSVIYDEYLNSMDLALSVLDVAEEQFSDDASIINQRAKTFFNANRDREGIVLASKALELKGLPSIEYNFCCRNAGIASSKVGDWGQAYVFFNKGIQSASANEYQKAMGVGFIADAAFALWKQEKYKESLSVYAESLRALEGISYSNNIKTHHLHATVRHSITWISMEAQQEGSSDLAEPLAGMCSNQEPHEQIVEHEIIDINSVWFLLEITEKRLGLDVGINRRKNNLDGSKVPMAVKSYKRSIELELAYQTGELDGLIKQLIDVRETIQHQIDAKSRDKVVYGDFAKLPNNYWEDIDSSHFLIVGMVKACVVLTVFCKDIPISKWKKGLEPLSVYSTEIDGFLDVLSGKKHERKSFYEEVAFALRVLRYDEFLPYDLWKASFKILNALMHDSLWVEESLDKLFSVCWLNAVRNQKSFFSNPQQICPKIEAEYYSTECHSKAKLAKVLKMSSVYLNISLNSATNKMLDTIALS